MWEDEWSVDVHRAVDAQGWEYCVEPSIGGWTPSEKMYQLNRRRRWIRNRKEAALRKKTDTDLSGVSVTEAEREGWEYSKLFSTKFHGREQPSDGVRRRRWRRRMEPNENLSGECAVVAAGNKETDSVVKYQPRLVVKHTKANTYQLRAYIYQARGLMAHDTATSASGNEFAGNSSEIYKFY